MVFKKYMYNTLINKRNSQNTTLSCVNQTGMDLHLVLKEFYCVIAKDGKKKFLLAKRKQVGHMHSREK